MEITFEKDSIPVSDILYASIETVSDYELSKLEEFYHGPYTEQQRPRSYRTYTSSYYTSSSDSKLREKIEQSLNDYWYEVGQALPEPSAPPHKRDKWTFAPKKRSTFSVGRINEHGDADVEWTFRTDYGKDPTGYHCFGESKKTLSLADDVIPVLNRLSQQPILPKSNAQKTGGFLLSLLELALDPVDSIYNDDSRETPPAMTGRLAAVCDEYEAMFGALRRKMASAEARTKKREDFLRKYVGSSLLIVKTKNSKKRYLEGHCGFNIFAKKNEIDYELERYRRQRDANIQKKKDELRADIIADFYARNLLSTPSLTNAGKLKAYSDLRDFCIEYIPSLAISGFKIDDFAKEHSSFISESACSVFKDNWREVCRSRSALIRGAAGEDKVFRVLRLYDDRIRILKDCVLGSCEHDFITITPFGILTIEVKTLHGNYELTQTGLLRCTSCEKVKPKDVAFQSKRHLETLRRALNNCSAFSASVPLREVICSAEPDFTIDDHYHYIPIRYHNTIDKELFPESGTAVLDDDEMNMIEAYLLENQGEAFTFDVFHPRGEINSRQGFIESFAEVASGFMAAQSIKE